MSMDESPTPTPTVAESRWGRVDGAGTVYVRTADGERAIGSWQADAPEEALAFYTRRYEDLRVQADLLQQRVASGAASPEDAMSTLSRLRGAVAGARAVGDLDGLAERLQGVERQVADRRAQRKAERGRVLEQARARKEAIATEVEAVAAGQDWRLGADRLRALLEEWKALPRLDRQADDALWHRFSVARTAFTRSRKAHYAELAQRREEARGAKEALAAEAESLAGSREWGPTSARFRDLMSRWKAAGPAPREAEDALWQRFRAAQDAFFAARATSLSELQSSERANLEAKRALVTEAEALLPVSDAKAAQKSLRSIRDRWEQTGKVPRDAVRLVDAALRAVEDAVRSAQETQWRRTNPEGKARAAATVAQLRSSIESLERSLAAARSTGDERAAAEAAESLAARRAWLVEAERALTDFGG